jgi:hypothetical protein
MVINFMQRLPVGCPDKFLVVLASLVIKISCLHGLINIFCLSQFLVSCNSVSLGLLYFFPVFCSYWHVTSEWNYSCFILPYIECWWWLRRKCWHSRNCHLFSSGTTRRNVICCRRTDVMVLREVGCVNINTTATSSLCYANNSVYWLTSRA